MVSWRVSKLVAAIDTPKATAVRETIDLLTYYLFKYNIRVIKNFIIFHYIERDTFSYILKNLIKMALIKSIVIYIATLPQIMKKKYHFNFHVHFSSELS